MISMELADIYAITSIYFIKGIMDAQSVYNPSLVQDVIDSESYALIVKQKKIELTKSQYMRFVLSDLSKHDLIAIRGSLTYFKNRNFTKELCTLLDFLYKMGCERYGEYEGRNMNLIMESVQNTSSSYFTPEGKLPYTAWHDLIRKYLTELQVVYDKIRTDALGKFMSHEILNDKIIKEQKQIDETRKQFILSGGDVPTERG